MEKIIQIKSDDFWVKIVEFLQQNWALIEEDESKYIVWFIHDGSGVFDKLGFNNLQEAADGLTRNGFKRYLDPTEKFTEFISPPKRPFFNSPRNIYSSGQHWK
jgi:hypothetical protein